MGKRHSRVGGPVADGSRVDARWFQNGRRTMAPHLLFSPPVHRASGSGAPSGTVKKPPEAPLPAGLQRLAAWVQASREFLATMSLPAWTLAHFS